MESAEFVKLADRIQVVAGIFAEKGVELVFETGQETAEDLNAFFDHLDGRGIDNVGVNFDPANMILYDKGEPIDALRKLLPRRGPRDVGVPRRVNQQQVAVGHPGHAAGPADEVAQAGKRVGPVVIVAGDADAGFFGGDGRHGRSRAFGALLTAPACPAA